MLPRAGRHDKEDSSGDSYNGRLLSDIKEISKALFLHKAPTKPLTPLSNVGSVSVGKTCLTGAEPIPYQRIRSNNAVQRGKKSWSWKKALKALTHIRQRRFNICFVLHAHSIEGLPSSFDGSRLVVQWKRDETMISTLPSKASDGVVIFDETLMHRCSVYGNRSGPHKSAEYDTELSLIYASAVEAPGLDLGKQWIDLTRLLPLSLDELENERNTRKWTMSFKLSGVANDATLNVSFGYSIIRDDLFNSGGNGFAASGSSIIGGMLRQARNVSGRSDHFSYEANPFHQTSPNLVWSKSIDWLCQAQKLTIGSLQSIEAKDMLHEHPIEHCKPESDFVSGKQMNECDNAEFCFTEKGIEKPKFEGNSVQDTYYPSTIEVIDVSEIFKDEDSSFDNETESYDRLFPLEPSNEESSVCSRQSFPGESESAYSSQMISASFDLESSFATDDCLELESSLEAKSSYKGMKSLDDLTESVASEFLNMLELEDHSYACASDIAAPDSPRERLLKEFENDAMASGNFFLNDDGKIECGFALSDQEEQSAEFSLAMTSRNFFSDYESESSDHEEPSKEFSFAATHQTLLESDSNNPASKDQFLIKRRKAKVLEDLETEALMREWGLDDKMFQNSPRIQPDGFGSPIELPLEEPLKLPPLGEGFGPLVGTKGRGYIRSMSSSLFRDSKNAASLIMHVSALVVLPAALGSDVMEILQSLASVGTKDFIKKVKALIPLEDTTWKTLQQVVEEFERFDLDSSNEKLDYGSLHQPGSFQSYNELESSRSLMFSGYVSLEVLAPLAMDRIESLLLEGLKIQCGMSDQEAPSSIGTNPINNLENISELIDLSLTLDEWSRLDAGIISDEDWINEQNLKILSAHQFNKNKPSGESNSFLADKLTITFTVLLRDPNRNYQPVGVPMLALIQVERDYLSTNPDNCCSILEESKSDTPLWRIIKVHLAGAETESSWDCSWGTKAQKQSGNRWLLESGIGMPEELQLSTSMAIISRPNTDTTRKSEDILWSLSSDYIGEETNATKIGALAPVTRNPNVIFPTGMV